MVEDLAVREVENSAASGAALVISTIGEEPDNGAGRSEVELPGPRGGEENKETPQYDL